MLELKKRGLAETTLKTVSQKLNQLSRNADLMNPESIRDFLARHTCSNSAKQKLANCYNYFVQVNELAWTKPKYKWERKIPLIPTRENINKIIGETTQKYAILFTIMVETGVEPRELSTSLRKDIDTEQGIINVQGCKGHNSRSFKLKPKTVDLLRIYMHKYAHEGERPFPKAVRMCEMWHSARERISKKLNEPQLKQIPLRNLRHHYATMLYSKTRDILLVMQRLGHKKIETTMFYTQLLASDEEGAYTCKTARNVKEATQLIENGFQYITDIDGLKLFKKRK